MAKKQTMDGNTAPAMSHMHSATSLLSIRLPHSSSMAEIADTWSAYGRKNLMGQELKLLRCKSEGGRCGPQSTDHSRQGNDHDFHRIPGIGFL